MTTDKILEMVDRLYARKIEMDNEMVDIMDQQSKLDKRRSRVEGMLCEIEYYIAMIEEE